MRIVYMGTPAFAVAPLESLLEAKHEIAGVITRIDKPAGRGRAIASPAVKIAAEQHGLTVYQPKRVREPEFIETLSKLKPEMIVVAAYGQILPKAILTLPAHGCINIHASLLPAYRGAAPINWAIMHGDQETGISIMHMDEGMDTGAVLMKENIPIGPEDTTGTLTEKLSRLGAAMIGKAVPLIVSGQLKPEPQDNARATMAPPLKKENGLIDWDQPAIEIHNQVRGVTPWPGAYTFLEGTLIKIIKTEVVAGNVDPGTLHESNHQTLDAGTGKDLLRIVMIQPAGKKPMSAAEFLRGHRGIEQKKFENR